MTAFRTLFALFALASLVACGGSSDPLTVAAMPVAATPAAASMPLASACNDPSCLGGADGLADQFRMASMERAAQAQETAPAYPNVPAHALVVSDVRMPEALGTATLQRVR